LVGKFLEQLNPVFDSVHEETFAITYEKFWSAQSGFFDLDAIDTRWLALLFIILAFGELLDCPQPCSTERQRECEESSQHFYWAARKAIVVAPTFSGESSDLVRAGILTSRYLIGLRRIPESWLTESFAVRMAQAQGMHIDGENWKLPRKVLETRRRIWSNLYILDRTTSLALGRPYTINDKHCIAAKITNIWVDSMTPEQAASARPQFIDQPTPSIYYLYQQELSSILGHISDECFNLVPTTSYSTYDRVLHFDQVLLDWSSALPAYFSLEHTDRSMDDTHAYLPWHRLWLHSAYHFARVTLHRTYVLLPSITDRYSYSREACISSACADLKTKLARRNPTMAERLKFNVAAHSLFNSALVLGVIAVREPYTQRTEEILEDLQAFCEKQHADRWVNEFELAEIRVVELCIASVRKTRQETRVESAPQGQSDATMAPFQDSSNFQESASNNVLPEDGREVSMHMSSNDNVLRQGDDWLNMWLGPTRAFPEPSDFQTWEELVEDLETRR